MPTAKNVVDSELTAMADPGWGIWGKCPPTRNSIQDRDTLIEQSITLKAVTMFISVAYL